MLRIHRDGNGAEREARMIGKKKVHIFFTDRDKKFLLEPYNDWSKSSWMGGPSAADQSL